MGTVQRLFRYPVKSAGGESLARLGVTPHGIRGDRVWACVDRDGVIVSAKHPQRGGPLLAVACRYEDDKDLTILDVPDAPGLVAGRPAANEALSEWLGRAVHMTRDASGDYRLRRSWPNQRGLIPEWVRLARPGTPAITQMAGPALRGSFVDYGAVHIITTADLHRLAATVGQQIDPVRFRPNLVVDGEVGLDAGMRLRVGQVCLRIEMPTARCVVPGLSPADRLLDAGLLRALSRFDRRQVAERGTAACFGVYAVPEETGALELGDRVEILSA